MSITAQDVKALRERTGAGMMDCKKALVEADGDIEKAVEALRVKGIAKAEKRGERAASEGTVQSYIHSNGKIGVLVEVDCETDFVARNDDFVAFARDLALHIAAAAPVSVDEDGVPTEDVERERRIAEEQFADKPENIRAQHRARARSTPGSRTSCCCASRTSTRRSTKAARSRRSVPRSPPRPARTSSSAASRGLPLATESEPVGGGCAASTGASSSSSPARRCSAPRSTAPIRAAAGDRAPDRARPRPRRRDLRSSSAAATSSAAWPRRPPGWTARPATTWACSRRVLNALALQDALEKAGVADARAVGAGDLRGRRALHPPPRDAPPREGPRRDLRGRHRQPVLHDRHGRGAARDRDARRGDPDGEERGGGRLHGRPGDRPRAPSSSPRSRTWRPSSGVCA